ncbi:MAG: hypothetical protein ACREMY_19595 [bacterium]
MEVRWRAIAEVDVYVRGVLEREASEIPTVLIESHPWRQVPDLALSDLHVDESMVARHDDTALHQRRRDGFIALVTTGKPLLPLIALGCERHLVDGYARLRALRKLGVDAASVIIQVGPDSRS